jgi:hypothetical protein
MITLSEPMNCNCRYKYFYDRSKWCPTCLNSDYREPTIAFIEDENTELLEKITRLEDEIDTLNLLNDSLTDEIDELRDQHIEWREMRDND